MDIEKEIKKIKDKIRSGLSGQKTIKVIYLGDHGGFHFGKVIEATARHARPSAKKYPYPKWRHCDYMIEDEDGDTFPVSDNGVTFHNGFYLVSDEFELGWTIEGR